MALVKTALSKKTLVGTLAAVIAATALVGGSKAVAQAGKEKTPSKVGLIDMAEVFKEYVKFKALREDLAGEINNASQSVQGQLEEFKRVQEQLKSGQFKDGTPQFKELEQKLIQLGSGLEAQKKVKQRDMLRQESDIYKTVYLEVQAAVAKFAEYRGYDMILRFNRQKVAEADNPQEILQSMNRQVVYHNVGDDVTDIILQYLNSQYEKSGK